MKREPTASEVSRKTIEALRRFTERLESGEDIPVTVVSQERTPDGPLTTFESTTLDEFLSRENPQ